MTDHEDADTENTPESGQAPPSPGPTVVGIGASAGGLTALREFFAHVPEGNGLAWVVVVHLSPEHESHLADLLQQHVHMPVLQVRESVPLEVDHVYVIPPGANLSAVDTHLRLSKLEASRYARAPIDHFFRTLASTHDGHSVGVILTGTGSDGALGVKAIKERNGLVVVQDPMEAEYDGMPQSAISTGMVDLVLPLAEIPQAIVRSARTEPRVPVLEEDEDPEKEPRRLLQRILTQLRTRTGRDFTRYKPSTVLRRIQRRMQLLQIADPDAYLERLREEPEEARALCDDLLITVTNFFRDAEVWERLEAEVVPALFAGRGHGDSIRVWSVGCATGEEAYTLTMVLLEEAARREEAPDIQVFASDLHERSLERAREGFYPGDIETDVSPERLGRFFFKDDGGYRVKKEVRERVIFAPHNLLSDPPFSRLDLVACRNVMIYLQREVQQEVLGLFHYALRPEGYLLLGTSETVDGSELFHPANGQRHLYRKRIVHTAEPRLPLFAAARALPAGLPEGLPERAAPPHAFGALHRRLLEQHAPPSVLVAPDQRVVHLSAGAGRFLVHPGGEPTTSVAELVREELRLELRAALHAARAHGEATRSRPIPVRFDGQVGRVVLEVRPATEAEHVGFALVVFEDHPEAEAAPLAPEEEGRSAAESDRHARTLESELDLTRQRLQAIIEEYETTQEEMRASHEELQSANEELRSMMEELETSKEELQSMNEELQTVNQENRHRVAELSQLSGDLQNLLSASQIATLFLDRELRILRFTPALGELFNARPADRGRPISDLTHRLGYDTLRADAEQVLRTLIPVEREVADERGRWYLTRVLPYRSPQDRIEGVVITFVEITDRRRAEEEVHQAKVYAESIIETLHEPLLVLHPDLRVRTANSAFYEHFQVRREETQGRLVYELGNGQWDIPALHTLLEEVLPDNKVFTDYEVAHEFQELGKRVMMLNARRLDHVQFILLGIRDITGRKRAEEALHELNEMLERRVAERTAELEQEITERERAEAARREVLQQLVTAEENERQRIARELHDSMAQLMTALLLRLKTLELQIADSAHQARLQEVGELAERIGREMQHLALELRPPALSNLGLELALQSHLEEWSARHGIEADFHSNGLDGARLPPEVETTLYRIVQEGLTNVLKHAGATRVSLLLERRDGWVRAIVEDDGQGFDLARTLASPEKARRLGLRGMRERVALLDGTLEIESSPGGGATVFARIPLQPAPETTEEAQEARP